MPRIVNLAGLLSDKCPTELFQPWSGPPVSLAWLRRDDAEALKVQKGTYAMTPIFGSNTTAITSDKYGYVTVTFGSFSGPANSFIVFDPNGNSLEDGGGASFMLNTDQAVLPSTLH